jgi:hypothetical protein
LRDIYPESYAQVCSGQDQHFLAEVKPRGNGTVTAMFDGNVAAFEDRIKVAQVFPER